MSSVAIKVSLHLIWIVISKINEDDNNVFKNSLALLLLVCVCVSFLNGNGGDY